MSSERFDLLNLTSSFKYLNMFTNIGSKREERENSSAAYFTPSGQGPRAKVSRPNLDSIKPVELELQEAQQDSARGSISSSPLYLPPAIAPLATVSASSGE